MSVVLLQRHVFHRTKRARADRRCGGCRESMKREGSTALRCEICGTFSHSRCAWFTTVPCTPPAISPFHGPDLPLFLDGGFASPFGDTEDESYIASVLPVTGGGQGHHHHHHHHHSPPPQARGSITPAAARVPQAAWEENGSGSPDDDESDGGNENNVTAGLGHDDIHVPLATPQSTARLLGATGAGPSVVAGNSAPVANPSVTASPQQPVPPPVPSTLVGHAVGRVHRENLDHVVASRFGKDPTSGDRDEQPLGRDQAHFRDHHWVLDRVGSPRKCFACGMGFSASAPLFRCSRSDCAVALHESPACAGAGADLAGSPPCAGVRWLGRPVLALTNRRSGSGQARRLVRTLRRLLGPDQVFDLVDTGGPAEGVSLMVRRFGPTGFRIVTCGGDGTFSWVMGYLASLPVPRAPMATLPLGTGNDLARQLGWGGGYTGEPVAPILDRVATAKPVPFDRWTVRWNTAAAGETSTRSDPNPNPNPNSSSSSSAAAAVTTTTSTSTSLVNYFSVGFDASTALGFHELRERRPGLFFARLVNKALYGVFGCREMFVARSVASAAALWIDGVRCEIPSSAKALCVLNIGSFASGTDPWGARAKSSRDPPPATSTDDGIVEVVALPGPLHFGLMTVTQAAGLRSMHAVRLGQGTRVEVAVGGPIDGGLSVPRGGLSAQVDGEPRRVQANTRIVIELENRVTMLQAGAGSAET